MRHKFSTDDLRLWWLNTRDVTPLHEDVFRPLEDSSKVTKPHVSYPAPTVKENPSLHLQQKSRQILRKQQIEAELDLHGYSHDQAWSELLAFILRARASGKRTALVITGKGSLQSDRTLRRFVPRWLEEPVFIKHINGFQQALQKDGGLGAYYIFLKKKS